MIKIYDSAHQQHQAKVIRLKRIKKKLEKDYLESHELYARNVASDDDYEQKTVKKSIEEIQRVIVEREKDYSETKHE